MQYILVIIALFFIVKIMIKIFESGIISVLIGIDTISYGVIVIIGAIGYEIFVFSKVARNLSDNGSWLVNIITLLILICLFVAWIYLALSIIFLGKWIMQSFFKEDIVGVIYVILNNVLIKMIATIVAIMVSMKYMNMDEYGNGFGVEMVVYDDGYINFLYEICINICRFLDKIPEILRGLLVLISTIMVVVDSRIVYVYSKKQVFRMFPFISIKGILSYWRVLRFKITHKGMSYICQNCNMEYTDFIYKCHCGNEIKKIAPRFGFSRSTLCFKCGSVIGVEDDLCRKINFKMSADNLTKMCPHCKSEASEFDKRIAKQCIVSVLGDEGLEHKKFVHTFIYEFIKMIEEKQGYRYSVENIAINNGESPADIYDSIKSDYVSGRFDKTTGFEFAMKVYKAYLEEIMMLHVYNLNVNGERDNNRNKVVGMKKKQAVYVIYSQEFKKVIINTVDIFRHVKDMPMIDGKFDIDLIVVNISNDVSNSNDFEDMIRSEYENEYTMLISSFGSVKFEIVKEKKDVLTVCEPAYRAGMEYLKSRR